MKDFFRRLLCVHRHTLVGMKEHETSRLEDGFYVTECQVTRIYHCDKCGQFKRKSHTNRRAQEFTS